MNDLCIVCISSTCKQDPLPLCFQHVEFLNNFVINLKASCTSNRTSVEGGWVASGSSHGSIPSCFLFSPSGCASNSLLMAAHFTVQRVCSRGTEPRRKVPWDCPQWSTRRFCRTRLPMWHGGCRFASGTSKVKMQAYVFTMGHLIDDMILIICSQEKHEMDA
jgi:hypothetical protein